MMRINFKQPKHIFPPVVSVPLCVLVYFVMQTFERGGDTRQTVAIDRINIELPEANTEEAGDKMTEMSRRFGDEDAFTVVGATGGEEKNKEELEHSYGEEELNRLDAAEAERIRQQQEMEGLERSLTESRKHIDSYAYGSSSSGNVSRGDFAHDSEEIQRRSYQQQKVIESGLGFGNPEVEEAARKQRADSIAKARMEEKEHNRPNLVVKSSDVGAGKFHTVSASDEAAEASLIRAMIDQTIKVREGTRLYFKLLDDVTISGTRLWKGTYPYGTVIGFGGQRVRAAVISILMSDRFIKVELSAFDNDGMEDFYVPEPVSRDFVKDVGASTVQQNANSESEDDYGSGISGETIALQALQDMYNFTTPAISSNIRKDKVKIRYNTIVYLVSSDDARQVA